MSAIDDIVAERKRQIEVEGWDLAHDDKHDMGELADAAAAYTLRPILRKAVVSPYTMNTIFDRIWPWAREWWKPQDRRRDLVKAGALIVAEIERLDRASAAKAA
jgi:hypothetical protein